MKKVILLSAIALSISVFATAQTGTPVQDKAAAKKAEIKEADAKKEHGQTTPATNANSNEKAKAKLAEMKKKGAQKEHGHTSTAKSSEDATKAAAAKKAEFKARDAKKDSKATTK